MVDGQTVDQKGADAHLLEPAGRPPEEVALGRSPVLTVDTADTVTAAPKRDPDRQPQLEEILDERECLGSSTLSVPTLAKCASGKGSRLPS